MSDTPQLVVVDELSQADSGGGPGRFTIREAIVHQPSVGEVQVWLREQGAGNEGFWCSTHEQFDWNSEHCWVLGMGPDACFMDAAVVTPLNPEPPKESG